MKKFKVLKLVIIIFVFISVIFINHDNLALGKGDIFREKNISIESREEKGERFYKSDRIVQGLKIVFSLGVPIIILSTGSSAKLRNVSKG
ncbi:hypothetical protein [Clostridium sp.]